MLAGRTQTRAAPREGRALPQRVRCALCGGPGEPAGTVAGRHAGRDFALRFCRPCGFAYVSDPLTDLSAVYDDAYYEGRGADPLVNYAAEVANARTVRRHEWRGILAWARSLVPVDQRTRWLDFGCGTGGLVAFLCASGVDAVGYEPGSGAARFRLAAGDRYLDAAALGRAGGRFDVVSAIEVVEHLLDPVAELRRLRTLLRPGGLLLLTTGNAAPYRERLARWRYVVPEVHISFFEPRGLARALEAAGFQPEFPGFTDGWSEIYRFKLAKQLGLHSAGALGDALPWTPAARLLDRALRLSAQPIGWATGAPPPPVS